MNDYFSISNVSKIYDSTGNQSQTLALDNVSFNVNQGEFITVLGPSGCGKSTLLRIIWRARRSHTRQCTLEWTNHAR